MHVTWYIIIITATIVIVMIVIIIMITFPELHEQAWQSSCQTSRCPRSGSPSTSPGQPTEHSHSSNAANLDSATSSLSVRWSTCLCSNSTDSSNCLNWPHVGQLVSELGHWCR